MTSRQMSRSSRRLDLLKMLHVCVVVDEESARGGFDASDGMQAKDYSFAPNLAGWIVDFASGS